jgi:hypothetical protein
MAQETIVPRSGRSATGLDGQAPTIRPVASSIQPSQFSAPPQVEWTAPSRSNELLQVSEALSELNPQLKAFGTAYIRDEAVEAKLSERIAQEDANILSLEKAREIGKKDVKQGIAEGLLKPEQTPQYYTALQKLSAQRVAKSDYNNFILNAKDQTTGASKYADRLNNPLTTEDPYSILEEASNDWIQTNSNNSQIFNSSAREQILKTNELIAEQAVKIRWQARQGKMQELLSQEGQDILFDTNLRDEDKQAQVQQWLTKVSNANVPNVFNDWAKGSLQPYILRLAKDNPDGARSELQKYENIPTQTGAKLGAGGNFGVFQDLYSRIDDIDERDRAQNETSRAESLSAIQDQAFNVGYTYLDKVEDPNDLLDPAIQKQMLAEMEEIPLQNGSKLSLKENPAYAGQARAMLAEQMQKLVRNEYREDPESLGELKIALQKGDIDTAEGIVELIDEKRGWGRNATNSRPFAMIEIQKLRDGVGLAKNPYVVDSVDKIEKVVATNITQLDGNKGSEIVGQTLLSTASRPVINQKIQDKLRVVIEEERKINPKKSEAEIIQGNIQKVAVETQTEVFKEAQSKFEKLSNSIEKSKSAEASLRADQINIPEGFVGELFKEKETYNGQRFESPSVLNNRYRANAKRRLMLRDAGLDKNSPGITQQDRMAIASIKEQDQKIYGQINKILPLLAKDIIEGKVDVPQEAMLMDGGGFGFAPPQLKSVKYKDEELTKKKEQYWDLKIIGGFSPTEISKGKTDEGLPIPMNIYEKPGQNSVDQSSGIGERVKVFSTHFQSASQMDELIKEYQAGNKDNALGGIFKRLELNTDDEQDYYVQQQLYLLGLYR